MIRKIQLTVTLTGATGSARTVAPVSGRVLGVHVAYTGQSGTCDVTVAAELPALPILALVDANTSGWFFPRDYACDTAGAELTFDATEPVPVEIPVDGYIGVAVTGGSAGSVVVTLLIEG